jgi:hypothetical protein
VSAKTLTQLLKDLPPAEAARLEAAIKRGRKEGESWPPQHLAEPAQAVEPYPAWRRITQQAPQAQPPASTPGPAFVHSCSWPDCRDPDQPAAPCDAAPAAVNDAAVEAALAARWKMLNAMPEHVADNPPASVAREAMRAALNAAFPALLADNARLRTKLAKMREGSDYWYERNHDAEAKLAASEAALRDAREELNTLRESYYQLLFAVGNKYEGESRHQTALRYIIAAERPSDAALAQEQPHAAQQEGR